MSSNSSSNNEYVNNYKENTSNVVNINNPIQGSPDTHINSNFHNDNSFLINNSILSNSDKEKLFHDFMIFQNFMKMQNLMKNNPLQQYSETSFQNFESMNLNHLDKKIEAQPTLISIENPIKIKIEQSNCEEVKEKQSDDKIEDLGKQKLLENQQLVINNKEGKTLKLNDIPIKPHHQNFIEILEMQLSNENHMNQFKDKGNKSNINFRTSNYYKNKHNDESIHLDSNKENKDGELTTEMIKDDFTFSNSRMTQIDNIKALDKSHRINKAIKKSNATKSLDLRNCSEVKNKSNCDKENLDKNNLFSSKNNYIDKFSTIVNEKDDRSNYNRSKLLKSSNMENDDLLETNGKEKSNPNKIKNDYEKLIDDLNHERKLFQEYKIKEKKDFETWKTNEILKLKSKAKPINRDQEIIMLKTKLQQQNDKEKHYLTTIDNLKKEVYQQQNIIVNLNSKLNHYEELLNIDKLSNKQSKREKERNREKFIINEDQSISNEFKPNEVKAIKKQYLNNKLNCDDIGEEVIKYDKLNIGEDGYNSNENSLSDIDEKRSFDERSIKIKNHVPQINKLNIVKIPKKTLNNNMNSKDEFKVELMSLYKNEETNNNSKAIIKEPYKLKRAKSKTDKNTCKLLREEDSKLKEKIEGDTNNCWDMKFPEKYHGLAQQNSKIIKHEKGSEGTVILIYDTDKKEIIFPNGIRKLVYDDGYSIVYLNNKDLKQTYPDGKVVYYFNDEKITQTSFNNGMKVVKFSNGQIENYFPDGSKEIK